MFVFEKMFGEPPHPLYSFASFSDFCHNKPRDEEYVWQDHTCCAVAQYLEHNKVWMPISDWPNFGDLNDCNRIAQMIPESMSAMAYGQPIVRTFGELADLVEERCRELALSTADLQ